MKLGQKEVILGAFIFFIGLVVCIKLYADVIKVLLSLAGPVLLVIGAIITWIGFEDLKEGI